MGELVIEKTATCPALMIRLSVYQQFWTALWSLAKSFKEDVQAPIYHLNAASELSCTPSAKLHPGNLIGDIQIARKVWNDIYLLAKLPRILSAI